MAPELKNPYLGDELLQDIILRHCPPQHFERVNEDLTLVGERIVNEIDALGDECERNPPTLRRTDAWGKRIDEIQCTRAWYDQHAISAQEGLIGRVTNKTITLFQPEVFFSGIFRFKKKAELKIP